MQTEHIFITLCADVKLKINLNELNMRYRLFP